MKLNAVHVSVTPEVLVDACMELVTVNGSPFSLMEALKR